MTTISLSSLNKVTASTSPRVLVYGPEGIGKTTLSSEFPNPVFIQIEDGTPGDIELTSFGKIATYSGVIEALFALASEDHEYKTVVIDSITAMQDLVYAETCRRGDDEGKTYARLEDMPFGKGYIYAMAVWSELLSALRELRDERGMGYVLIAHSIVAPFKDPETSAYDQYQIAIHASNKPKSDHRGLIQREMDAIILMKKNVVVRGDDKAGIAAKKEASTVRTRATGGEATIMHTVGKPAFTAKNRYGMPAQIRFDKGKGYEALAQYFPQAGKLSVNEDHETPSEEAA